MGKDLKGKDIGKGIRQRPDGRYQARAKINGKEICLYNMSLSQLKKDFEEEKIKLSRQEKGVEKDIVLSEWYQEWFTRCKSPQLKSDMSRKTYDRKIRNTFISILGNKQLKQVTQLNIQDASNELLSNGYKERSVREALGVLRECMDSAVVNLIIPVNPCQQILIQDKNEAQKERRVLDKWEQDMFLEEVKNSYYNEAYQFLLLTGVRIGEFSGLQWQDIDWNNKRIKISRSMSTSYIDGVKTEQLTTPKTANSYRYIPFFGETEQILKSWKIKQDIYKKQLGSRWRAKQEHGDLIFTSTMGSPVTRYVLSSDLRRVEKNLNLKEKQLALQEGRYPRKIEHIHPHAFRHTFATRCFEKGMTPLVVQTIMGHSNYSTTISYTHVLPDQINKDVVKAGNFLS